MGDLDIYCNFSKCRKRLSRIAWITSCSHAFCEEHGDSEFSQKLDDVKTCPTCSTSLSNKYDIVKVDLNPSPQFRSMVLAGLRPEIVFDISNRALAFWSYQIYMEILYQSSAAKRSRDKITQLEEYYESIVIKLKTDIQARRRKEEELKKELTKQTQRSEELIERLNEMQRQFNSVQASYEALRRTQLNFVKANEKEQANNFRCHENGKTGLHFSLGPTTLDTLHPRTSLQDQKIQFNKGDLRAENDAEEFTFKPVTPSPDATRQWRNPLVKRQRK
ncbi:E3 ubiquitin-protein ligase CCNB1IP1-like isoform X1 [Schistocerca cancellata]|uniref:E3 ubiquitin-protein ligase CCNB1IP1-like isoform X1 n=2 Tax=Schistocerca cancellata TaxID=274614 RepID=UPI002118AD99|nr:E3 ubiquitin-protein ligase CCNB1IP1-like isoform X1 [Schistocerca cancellata]